MHAGNSTDLYVTVICPTCHTRLNPRRELIGKRVRCPDCGVPVRVEEGPAERVAPAVAAVGEYSLSDADRPVEQPKTFLVKCPTCGTRLFPNVNLVGKRVRCPDCKEPVKIPPPPIERAKKPPRPPGEYHVGAKVEPIVMPESTLLKYIAKVEKEEVPPPPPPARWWLTGVLDFPWRASAGSRWVVLAFFATVASAIGFLMGSSVLAMSRASSAYEAAPSAFLIVIFISATALVGWLTMGFTTGVVAAIVQSTAAGNDDVADWSDAEMRDAMWNVTLAFPLAVAVVIAYGGFKLTQLVAPQWAWWGALSTFYLVFPPMFFSVMEHGSALTLITSDALKLIWGHFRGWALLMVECAVLLAPVVWLTAFGLRYSIMLPALFGGPIYAALVMICARLMGRFFYRAHEVTEARRMKKEQEEADQAAEEAIAEEPEEAFDEEFDFGV
jgi:DNA-directed RNA polymerase subunit RPC12/RpoP